MILPAPPTARQLAWLTEVYGRVYRQTRSVPEALRAVLTEPREPYLAKEATRIFQAVAAHFKLSGPTALYERSRRPDIVKPRQVAMYLMWRTGMQHWRCAAAVGLRNPTTSLHAVRRVRASRPLRAVADHLAGKLGLHKEGA